MNGAWKRCKSWNTPPPDGMTTLLISFSVFCRSDFSRNDTIITRNTKLVFVAKAEKEEKQFYMASNYISTSLQNRAKINTIIKSHNLQVVSSFSECEERHAKKPWLGHPIWLLTGHLFCRIASIFFSPIFSFFWGSTTLCCCVCY